MKSYCVYKHTSPSKKVYIGITCKNPLYRWQKGYGYSSNEHFFRAIVKYGWDNFKHEILCEGLSKEEAEVKEIELISFYNSTDERYGYNISSGGENHFAGYHHSEKTKRKIGDAQRGELNHRFGKDPWNKGKKFDIDVCIKMSENRPKKAILQFDLNGVLIKKHESMTKAAKSVGVSKESICAVCKGKRKTIKGYVWRYADDN